MASGTDLGDTHAIKLTDSMSLLLKVQAGMGSPEWHSAMTSLQLWRLLWVCCPGHAGVRGNDRVDWLAGKAKVRGSIQATPHIYLPGHVVGIQLLIV